MAVLGVPLDAIVSNFGQADSGYHSVGSTSAKVVSQGFTTGPHTPKYSFQGIGFNVEGSGAIPQVPDGPASVSVAVHADSNGSRAPSCST